MGNCSLLIHKTDGAKWLNFELNGLQLRQSGSYGFRLQSQDAVVGRGEAVTAANAAFNGQEWKADSKNSRGYFLSYFSLAYKVELRT